MFLAGKVEETPRPLKDVIFVSYEIINKKDPGASQKIKQKEVYEQQKELILNGEKIVLSTLGFDLNVYHPYKPLVEAIKKFKVAQNALAQVAWNFVNDGYVQELFPSKASNNSMCLVFSSSYNEKWLAVYGHLSACNLSLIILRLVQYFLRPSSLK
jgi:hypothetical protein